MRSFAGLAFAFALVVTPAQAEPRQGAAESPQPQCWDVAANQVREKSEPTPAGSGGTSGGTPAPTEGMSGSSEGMSGVSPGTTGSAPAASVRSRPVGMPNC
jgi:hypothetical protein